MKEATGELSMTTITIIAIIAIMGIITFLIPLVKEFINNSWNNMTGYVDVVEKNINM